MTSPKAVSKEGYSDASPGKGESIGGHHCNTFLRYLHLVQILPLTYEVQRPLLEHGYCIALDHVDIASLSMVHYLLSRRHLLIVNKFTRRQDVPLVRGQGGTVNTSPKKQGQVGWGAERYHQYLNSITFSDLTK